MSDFKLDIDFPYSLPERENFMHKPQKVEYDNNNIRLRHHGAIVEKMLKSIVSIEDNNLKTELIALIANHMRKSLANWNKDNATDDRIINDIKILSNGLLEVTSQQIRNSESRNENRNENRSENQKKDFYKK
jgi:hypothetical protein